MGVGGGQSAGRWVVVNGGRVQGTSPAKQMEAKQAQQQVQQQVQQQIQQQDLQQQPCPPQQ